MSGQMRCRNAFTRNDAVPLIVLYYDIAVYILLGFLLVLGQLLCPFGMRIALS